LKSRRCKQGALRRAGTELSFAVSLALVSVAAAGAEELPEAADTLQQAPGSLQLRQDSEFSLAGMRGELTAQVQQPQETAAAAAQPAPKRRAPRLSDWLLGQPPSDAAYLPGLSWHVPGEVPAQKALQLEIVSALSGADRTIQAHPEAMRRLRDWVASLPVTGRVPISVPDARWLQMNPARDPVIGPGHNFVLPRRPLTVTVVTPDGRLCQVEHRAGHEARGYLDACAIRGSDTAWIAQPDGRVQRYGIALWNRETQDEPAPGAWIWAPPRGSGWTESFSERLIRFLATQGPAPDHSYAGSKPNPQSDGLQLREPGGEASGLSLSLSLAAISPKRETPELLTSRAALLEKPNVRSRGLQVTASDWGGIGLLQTPTARMRERGDFAAHFSNARPYRHGNIFVQPFDWMEVGFRYTRIADVPYDPTLRQDRAYIDKSIDLKLRVWPESAYAPQIAIGFRDIGGTGLFAGEYVVANKRTGDFDWSLGIGWGHVGGRGNIRNPLSRIFGDGFDRRKRDVGLGGDFDTGSYFRGPAALLGGVQYQTPWDSLILKAEYDGNDYQSEPDPHSAQPRALRRARSPVNFGVVYRPTRWADVTLSFQRGNTFGIGLTFHTSLPRLTQPKVLDPAPVPVSTARPAQAPDWSRTTADLRRQTDWEVRSIEQRGNEVRVVFDDANAAYWRYRVDRAAGVLHRDAPASIERFTFTYRQQGLDVAEHTVDREAWVADKVQQVRPPSERRDPLMARPPQEALQGEVVATADRPAFTHGFGLGFGYIIGGADAFALYQLGLRHRSSLRLRANTWVQADLHLRLLDNFDRFETSGDSQLPRVRTLMRDYVRAERFTMTNLQVTHVDRLGENQYYSLYGGYLEEMFGGVGGEWLYRPFGSRFAVGVDINAVRQREFAQRFGFRDYQVATGHASLYWDTGWHDVLATLHVGRYLARDVGATLNLSRVFRNGVAVGAFATRTNVSAEQFGEGSFDKGVYLSIPFDAFFGRTSSSFANFLWRPLTRDGGAMLWRRNTLYAMTSARSPRTLQWQPAPQANERLIPADRQDEWKPDMRGSEPYTRVTAKAAVERWTNPGTRELDLVQALDAQELRNAKVDFDTSYRLNVTASTDSVYPISRAVGRAARTALLQAPLETRGINVTLLDGPTPQVRYEFFDVDRLRGYFHGRVSADELRKYVKVEWINPAARERDPLARLNDLSPETRPRVVTGLVPDTLSVNRVANDLVAAAETARDINWLRAGAIGAGLVLSSAALDNRAHRFARDHADRGWLRHGVRAGNALPWAGFVAAGALALDGSDPVRSRTGYAAVYAGATAFAASTGLKYAVGRARPNTGLGRTHFDWGSTESRFHSFPSRHTAVAWAVATPFALEYDMPWLYGLAAATNLSRIGSREHWVSDTVAGSLIGYGLGRVFWQSGRDQSKREPRLYFDGSVLGLGWDW
jgi:membrane-associated phospholipid phosphatase